ncbi:hypothetical protein B4168_1828 [Anoxybacillus flavithermus]|nr:hypothetical protein B4168_1828 [Anoxybacillus flavithermus]OAO85483.1 hypothetical protein GT23_2386 [Parageobacillus thermoglucosidasius]
MGLPAYLHCRFYKMSNHAIFIEKNRIMAHFLSRHAAFLK